MILRNLPFMLLIAASACTTAPSPAVQVRMETALGAFTIALAEEAAPITCANFLKYVDAGSYRGGRFHRSVRLDNQTRSDVLIEVIQGGANQIADQEGFPAIVLERTRDTGLRHLDGTISMARGSLDSARSDFFICVGPQPSLDFGGTRNDDGQGFAAFGRVAQGMDVIRAIHTSATKREQLTPAITIRSASRVK